MLVPECGAHHDSVEMHTRAAQGRAIEITAVRKLFLELRHIPITEEFKLPNARFDLLQRAGTKEDIDNWFGAQSRHRSASNVLDFDGQRAERIRQGLSLDGKTTGHSGE